MEMKTLGVVLGLATLVGSGCGTAAGDREEAVPVGADRELIASEGTFSIPAIVRTHETARAIDRSFALDASAGQARAATIAKPGDVVTVSGRVLQLSGASVASLPVVILGQGLGVKTDDHGNFTFPKVKAPYDVAVGTRSGSVPNVVIYKGLLRTDPRLVAFVEPEFTATITGFVSGGAGFPQPPNHFAFVQIGSDGGGMGFSQVFSPFGEYAASAQWSFTNQTIAYLTAIQFSVEGGKIKEFTGGATAQFPVIAGSVNEVQVPLHPVKSGIISGKYMLPAGYSTLAVVSALESARFSLLPMPVVAQDPGRFSLPNPVIPDRPILVAVEAFSPSGGLTEAIRRGVKADTNDLSIAAPEAPDIIAPPMFTTGVDHDTIFQTTEFAEGVYLFQFSASATDPTFTVVSSDPVARIPDVSDLGAPLPPSHHYFLQMTGYGPFTDIDDFAGPTGPLPSPELLIVASPFLRFVTAP